MSDIFGLQPGPIERSTVAITRSDPDAQHPLLLCFEGFPFKISRPRVRVGKSERTFASKRGAAALDGHDTATTSIQYQVFSLIRVDTTITWGHQWPRILRV